MFSWSLKLSGALALLGFAGWASAVSSETVALPAGTNVSLNKPYILSPKPNYEHASGDVATTLTDGNNRGGLLNPDASRIGWYKRSPIIFRQRLDRETGIGRIEITSFAKARADVKPPSAALVYAADDGGLFQYVGDAVKSYHSDPQKRTGGVIKTRYDFAPIRAREIMIVLYREGSYLLLYEVGIFAARTRKKATGTLGIAAVRNDAQIRRRTGAERRAGTAPIGGKALHQRYAWPLPAKYRRTDGAGCRTSRISPWGSGTPQALLAAPATKQKTVHATGGWMTGAIRVENLTGKHKKIKLSAKSVLGTKPPEISVVHFVLGFDYQWRADVVVGSETLRLPPRSFSLIMARARVSDPGPVGYEVSVSCGGRRHVAEISGTAIAASASDRPYATTWSYLKQPTIRANACWPTLHKDMWIDTAVVHMTGVNKRINRRAEGELRLYLKRFANARRIMFELEMGMASALWPTDAETPDTEEFLRNWWAWVSKVVEEEGFRGEIAIYPIDEPRKKQIEYFNAVAKIFRKIAPNVPIYVTIGRRLPQSTLKSMNTDTMQVLDRLIDKLPASLIRDKEVHIYATKPASKTLDVSNYFRRLSWTAFSMGLRGAGVWSMYQSSGAASPDTGWSDFGGKEHDFGLLYAGRTSCIHPSRRLLAFQRGLEDFAVFSACQRRQKKGNLRKSVSANLGKGPLRAEDYDQSITDMVSACIATNQSVQKP